MGNEMNYQFLFKDFTKNINELNGLSANGKNAEEIKPAPEDLTSIFKNADTSSSGSELNANLFMKESASFYGLENIDADSDKYKELDKKFEKFFDEIDDLDGIDGLSYDDLEMFSTGYNNSVNNINNSSNSAVLGEPEAELKFGNGAEVVINIRDDIKNGTSIDGDANTGKFTITFGKSQAADETQNTDETDETQNTGETDETQNTGETDETQNTGETDETQNTGETDETQNTDKTDETQNTDKTDEAPGSQVQEGDKVDYTYVDPNGKEVNINVKDGWTKVVELGDKVKFEYPDGSAKIVSISNPSEVGGADNTADAVKPEENGNDDKTNTSNDKGNGYTVPDGSKPEYVVNVGGKNISVDIPDELRDQIKTVINTKTGEVSFKDKQGNEIKPEDINALVQNGKVEKTDKTDKVDKTDTENKTDKVNNDAEVDKTASLFKKDDRIKTDDKGNKYAEVTQWNDKYSENNCLYRIIDHSYDLDAMGIPRDEKGYPIDTDPKYVALEKAIMNANPEIYGNENGGWNPTPNGLTGRRNATIHPGDKIVLPEAYDIEELGIERPKVEKKDENKTDKPDVNDVKDEKAEVAIDNKNGTVVIDVDDDYFNSSAKDMNIKGDANGDEISIALFKDFDDYKEDANRILSQSYNTTETNQFIQEIKNSTDLSDTQRKELLAMFEEE